MPIIVFIFSLLVILQSQHASALRIFAKLHGSAVLQRDRRAADQLARRRVVEAVQRGQMVVEKIGRRGFKTGDCGCIQGRVENGDAVDTAAKRKLTVELAAEFHLSRIVGDCQAVVRIMRHAVYIVLQFLRLLVVDAGDVDPSVQVANCFLRGRTAICTEIHSDSDGVSVLPYGKVHAIVLVAHTGEKDAGTGRTGFVHFRINGEGPAGKHLANLRAVGGLGDAFALDRERAHKVDRFAHLVDRNRLLRLHCELGVSGECNRLTGFKVDGAVVLERVQGDQVG